MRKKVGVKEQRKKRRTGWKRQKLTKRMRLTKRIKKKGLWCKWKIWIRERRREKEEEIGFGLNEKALDKKSKRLQNRGGSCTVIFYAFYGMS